MHFFLNNFSEGYIHFLLMKPEPADGSSPTAVPTGPCFFRLTFLSTVMPSRQLKISHWRTIPHSQEIYKYSGSVIWAPHPARWKGWAEFSSAVTCSLWHRPALLSFKPVLPSSCPGSCVLSLWLCWCFYWINCSCACLILMQFLHKRA